MGPKKYELYVTHRSLRNEELDEKEGAGEVVRLVLP